VCVCVCVYVCLLYAVVWCVCVCMFACMYVCVFVCIYMYVCVCMCMCVSKSNSVRFVHLLSIASHLIQCLTPLLVDICQCSGTRRTHQSTHAGLRDPVSTVALSYGVLSPR
jgi:hypothetical protein